MRLNLVRALWTLLLMSTTVFAASPLDNVQFETKDPLKKLPKTNRAVQVTLKQQLQKGLKVRRPIEFEFVDGVVQMVDEDKLSIDTVNKAFAWSRQRNKFRPYVYFEASLVELAKRDGVDIKQELVDQKTRAQEAAEASVKEAERNTGIIARLQKMF
jgi:hypothetical protein